MPQKGATATRTGAANNPYCEVCVCEQVGFRKDSINLNGTAYVTFQGPCIDLKYYNKTKNQSTLLGACYNRDFPADNLPTSDSVAVIEFDISPGSYFLWSIDMRWWKHSGLIPGDRSAYRIVGYTNRYNGGVDTLKLARDTVIKFIWPDDTASGRFVKYLSYP